MSQTAGFTLDGLFCSSKFLDTLERIRLTTDTDNETWHEVLKMPAKDYQNLRLGKAEITDKLVENVSEHFHVDPLSLLKGRIDFKDLALRHQNTDQEIPESYSKAAFGRKRTSITSVNFLEKYVGWRLRLDAMKSLGIGEKDLQDPFSPISMRFITDLCAYLHDRQFSEQDFFAMGAFTYEGNKNSVIAQLFANLSCPLDAYEFFFNDCMKLFEQNCIYTITHSTALGMTVEYVTNPHVAAESGVPHLGNTHVCHLKVGSIANVTRYIGLPPSQIEKTSCVHQGDAVCTLEITFPKVRMHARV
ncbi:hypothetical protein [Pseudobdellovibrio exovorus]|uniref:4-vinyl reductase 4VR domain-containing protein n=1 Tax=Pseudobdellovibrio exovorus JSS TaxID=1184267 RepID=M4V7Z4_9BACT|nr:hypothetical protein [Pseudobdellovibrio exovorus]AGH94555.1 hypothetical protein A11Q_335 [Pseudobdellovibrio exovorus JSS]